MTDNKTSYLNKTFSDFKNNLINYAKTYFPNTYNDFSEASPGNLFIEMASYIGDVTSFYIDTQTQENFLLSAKEKENLFALAYILGYRPQMSYASTTIVDIFQLIPNIEIDGNLQPDYDYAVIVPENTMLTATNSGIKFITTDKIDFRDTNDTEITLYNEDYFLLKKQVKAISAEIKSVVLNFSTPIKFNTVNISDNNILQILDATDEQDNKWYEVPYLAQSTIFDKIENPLYENDKVPYLFQLKKVPRRFVSRFLSDGILQLEFGAGISDKQDNEILPTPDNINLGLVPGISNLYNNFNKASVFFTQEYGLAPNSNITVRYLVGGGIKSNIPSNNLTTIDKSGIYFPSGVDNSLSNQILNSISSTNPNPSNGGRGGDQIEEIRNNTLYAYQSQLRAVTKEDYMVRALSLPTNYGNIAKVYITQDSAREILQTPNLSITDKRNPLSLDMYILSYDDNKKLNICSDTLKNNLVSYIDRFRMATDAINIKDAFYINIGINFDITVQRGFNNNDVISNCILALKDLFNIEKWNINQPIVISDINSTLLQVKGVQSIVKIEIINKQDNTGLIYSKYAYDIPGATRKNNIYPSLDPSIFEIRYPDIDISGRIIAN